MKKIITCIDGSQLSTDVCLAGAWAARKLQSPLLLLHAIEKQQLVSEDLSGSISLGAHSSLLQEMAELDQQRSAIARKLGDEYLHQAAGLAEQHGCPNPEQVQRHGGIVEAITDLEEQAQLVVLGRSGAHSASRFKAIGSHIEQIVRRVQTPVLIASQNFRTPRSFMLAYDGRDTADRAVQRILAGGLLKQLDCHLVSVKTNRPDSEDKLRKTEALLRDNGFNVQASLLEGPIFATLQQYKQNHEIDLHVMGAFSRSKLATVFLGSNTLKMMEHSSTPMLVMR